VNSILWRWFPAGYRRTCNSCGYSWEIPRSLKRRNKPPTASTMPGSVTIGSVNQEGLVQDYQDIERVQDRHCPKCGNATYSQVPLRHLTAED
jgi:DNA-directed RNA polymerase subunit M/transcription elongation factor TFIIS